MKERLKFLLLLLLTTNSHQLLSREIRNTPEVIENNSNDYRLPNNTIPRHYKLNINPHLPPENFTFDGEVEISLEIVEGTKNLTLHASNLTIVVDETTLNGYKETILPDKHIIDDERDFIILTFSKELLPGNYTLHLRFHGVIRNSDAGLFKNSYKNDQNETVHLISTLFQPTYAREAFPCWDEPGLKATFEISIKHFPNYTVLSNMPMEKKRENPESDGKIWTDFKETPKMSTYLVAFLITNDLKRNSNWNETFTVWSRKNPHLHMRIVYEIGQETVEIFENYTKIPYVLEKQNHVAIPHLSEAIENWGLISYKEEDFGNPMNLSTDKIMTAYLLTSHEICHQWFGNLVTPKWWKDLWLSEGFCQYIQWIVASQTLDEPRLLEVFVATNKYEALDFERNSSVLTLTPDLKSNDEIIRTFETLTYCKGAAIVHMIVNILSKEVFDAGIRKYLQKHQFQAVNTDDLWESLTEAMIELNVPYKDMDIKKMMDPYLKQRGYPVVNVVRDYNTGTVKITQECLICNKFYNDTNSKNQKWWIPINFVTNSTLHLATTLPTHWLSPDQKELIIDGIDPNDWIIVNVENTGYYRVNYDKTNWNKIIDYLNSKNYSKIHVLNRLQIIEDAVYIFQNKKMEFSDFLKILTYLHQEDDYIPWIAGLRILNEFQNNQDNFIISIAMQTFAKVLTINSVLARVGSEQKENDDIFTCLLRRGVLKLSCDYKMESCLERADKYVSKVLENSNPDILPTNDKDWILCAGLRNANKTIWNSMLEVFRKTKDKDVLEALSCRNNNETLTKYLNLIIENDSLISDSQILEVIAFASKTNLGLTLSFVDENRKEIKERLNSKNSLSSVYENIIYAAKGVKKLEKIKNFIEEKEDQKIIEAMKPLISTRKEEIELSKIL
ncbi:thyrotropin-releasing hormone-degrading ectoenzyme-like [Leptopilina heterotoma]|uniref:thyrotropin-releasing hormone-degrading ectoenzyme-like n=1 Tax=Leptopilina heterotoma TaxID=63436 RepID=UPI001CA9ED01|nr:thyrotropin-releasing hormone-degrading ectoenzyme-like [Leptopilina heterotoma]